MKRVTFNDVVEIKYYDNEKEPLLLKKTSLYNKLKNKCFINKNNTVYIILSIICCIIIVVSLYSIF